MKIKRVLSKLLPCVAALAVIAPFANAADGTIPKPSESESVFVGNYGEVVRYPADYAADAKMHGPNEVVIFHPRSQELTTDDVKPADFERLGLMELFVEPKETAGISRLPGENSDLAALCHRREESLDQAGYQRGPMDLCEGDGGCSIVGINWPTGTCAFDVTAPVQFHQIYSESAGRFYILTSGADFTDPKAGTIAISLMESINPPVQEYSPQEEKKPLPETWSQLSPDMAWAYVWGAICGLLILSMAIPGRWRRRIRLAAAAALTFGNSAIVITLLACAAEQISGVKAVNNLLILGIGETVAFSAVGFSYALRAGSRFTAARAAVMLLAGVAAIGFFSLSIHDPPSPPLEDAALLSYWAMPQLGLLIGFAFGLSSPILEAQE